MPKISFIMQTKDRSDIIKESIDTIINQTEKDWELLVVDDHSGPKDNTREVVKSYKDERVRYIRMPDDWPGGIPEGKNFGNMFARSPIVAVADDDELYSPRRAELTVEAFEKHDCDVFYGNMVTLFKDTGEIKECIKFPIVNFDIELMKKYNLIPHSTAAYKREIAYQFPYNSFFRRAQDYDFFSRLALAGKKFYFCPEQLMVHAVHGRNNCIVNKRQGFDELIKFIRGWSNDSNGRVLRKIFGEDIDEGQGHDLMKSID